VTRRRLVDATGFDFDHTDDDTCLLCGADAVVRQADGCVEVFELCSGCDSVFRACAARVAARIALAAAGAADPEIDPGHIPGQLTLEDRA